MVIGFNDEDSYVAETIIAMGGQVVSSTFTGIPDYGVVPKCGATLKHTVNEIVTDLFIVSIDFPPLKPRHFIMYFIGNNVYRKTV